MTPKTRKWILLVDDEEQVRESIATFLDEKLGKEIKIIQASDGVEAEAKLKNQTFHLIITDIRMPRKDGEDLIATVRESNFNETTPIIVVSAYAKPSIEKKFPFISLLEKPVDFEKLEKMVRTYFCLESTEKMVSGSIFSSLLESSLGFLGEALGRDDFQVGNMKLKQPGQPLTADYAAVITVNVGKVTNTFSVLCSKQTLEEIRDNSEKISGNSLDVICRSLGYVILKHVLTDCGIIDSKEVHVEDISQDPALLKSKKGIVVPINAINIDYKVFATTKNTKKTK